MGVQRDPEILRVQHQKPILEAVSSSPRRDLAEVLKERVPAAGAMRGPA